MRGRVQLAESAVKIRHGFSVAALIHLTRLLAENYLALRMPIEELFYVLEAGARFSGPHASAAVQTARE
jgi:hypothetical protein